MQLIQQQSFFHEKNDAADSTARFSFWGGRLGPLGPAPPQNEKMQLNQLHHFFHEKNFAAESTASFPYLLL